MQHSGYSQYNASGAAKLMYGPNPSCPLGYWTNAVIYVLKGGHMAQQKFQELQFAEAQKQLMAVLSLTEAGFIDGSELRELSAKERRVWKGLDSNREFEIVQNEEEISTQILNTLKSEPRNRKSPTWTSDGDTEVIHTAGKDDTDTEVKLLNDIDMPTLMERFKSLCGLQHDSLSAENLWHDRVSHFATNPTILLLIQSR
ncbi:hypothetical protein K435DRAFT_879636 [Dendrothele bispora CBS 962.96]|uniref:Uncharacterized protein n=1 Tax=Dendrothele bispora (strain CBS 962.96) TaxID=1314807 RepID=A0A4S8KL07_DENBC|nr:hypothetical protein K435DRAFT_879636 [Dendrothele bispora CBS 962.96]